MKFGFIKTLDHNFLIQTYIEETYRYNVVNAEVKKK